MHKMKDKGREFFEAMPGTMDQFGRTFVEKTHDRSFMRRTLPWLIVPALALIAKSVWDNMGKPSPQEMTDKAKNKAKEFMPGRNDDSQGSQITP